MTKLQAGWCRGLNTVAMEVTAMATDGLHGYATAASGASRATQEETQQCGLLAKRALKQCGIRATGCAITVDTTGEEAPPSDALLAIALAIAAESSALPPEAIAGAMAWGRIGESGGLEATRGELIGARAAVQVNQRFICAPSGASVAAVSGCDAWTGENLATLVRQLAAGRRRAVAAPLPEGGREPDLYDIHACTTGRRVLEIAAAGRHAVLLAGPPAAGKTMIARRLGALLPRPTTDEVLVTASIHSAAGLDWTQANTRRAVLRAPHHTAGLTALRGTMRKTHNWPGEYALAHNGVLLLDEIEEFPRALLETVIEPLENGAVTISRSWGTTRWPARFHLIATATEPDRKNNGGPGTDAPEREQWMRRLPERVRAQFDIIAHVPASEHATWPGCPGERNERIIERVARARQIARESEQPRPETREERVALTIAQLAGRTTPAHEDVEEARSLEHETTRAVRTGARR